MRSLPLRIPSDSGLRPRFDLGLHLRPSAAPLLAGVALLCASAGEAFARPPNVFINDVRIEGNGLRGQTFNNCDVTFDDNGDVRVTAKGYKISSMETTPATPPTPPPASPAAPSAAHHFYIATQQPRPGVSQWDVDVYINQVFVKRFRSKDADPLFEITRFLRPGNNLVHFTAKKAEGDRLSTSPNDFFELIVGDGEMRAGQVMLNKISSFRRDASEVGPMMSSETSLTLQAQ